jgi:hypothetical protein
MDSELKAYLELQFQQLRTEAVATETRLTLEVLRVEKRLTERIVGMLNHDKQISDIIRRIEKLEGKQPPAA